MWFFLRTSEMVRTAILPPRQPVRALPTAYITPSWNKVASERVVTPEIIQRIQKGVRSREFFRKGFDGPVFISRLNDDSIISNSHQWDAVFEDGDMWKAGLQTQGLYVSPSRDLVIAFFSTNASDDSLHRYLRPIATSGLFDK